MAEWSPQEVAALCYNEGWRDANLITMVAIVGAESKWMDDFQSADRQLYGLFALPGIVYLDPAESAARAKLEFRERWFDYWPSYVDKTYRHMLSISLVGVSNMFSDNFKLGGKVRWEDAA